MRPSPGVKLRLLRKLLTQCVDPREGFHHGSTAQNFDGGGQNVVSVGVTVLSGT